VGKLKVSTFLTLDGAMQTPGDASEFDGGGWQLPSAATLQKAGQAAAARAASHSKGARVVCGPSTSTRATEGA
jgi:hypothetical protein